MGSQRRQWAASGATMPNKLNSSWKDVPWDDDAILQELCRQNLVSRDPSNIKEVWRRWVAEHAASGAVNWDDHAVKLNQSTGEVVDQLGKKASVERKTIWERRVLPHKKKQYDLYGRRGWMDRQRLESMIKGHFYVRRDTIKLSQSKLTNTSESDHECPTNFRFILLECDYVMMGYSRHRNKLDQRQR